MQVRHDAGTAGRGNSTNGVRVVAMMEAAKAAVVLIAGFGLLSAVHVGAAQIAEALVQHTHLNPAKGYPHVFIDLARDTSNGQLRLLAAGAFGYAAMRCVEAFGLWRQRRWAEWFSVASGSIYVPFELVELARGVTVLRLATLSINLAVIAYMAYALRVSRQQAAH